MRLLQLDMDDVPSNMEDILVTFPVCQALMGWSNADARENMCRMSVTALVCQAPMGWSKADAR